MGLQEAGGLGFVSGKGTRDQHSDKTPDSATGTPEPSSFTVGRAVVRLTFCPRWRHSLEGTLDQGGGGLVQKKAERCLVQLRMLL